MLEQEKNAILSICLQAAFADGERSAAEASALERLRERLQDVGVDLEKLREDVLAGRRDLKRSAAELNSQESRSLAYEMAVCICEADGETSERERVFLRDLIRALGLDAGDVDGFRERAASLVSQPLSAGAAASVAAAPAGASPAGGSGGTSAPKSSLVDEKEVDEMILRQAIVCGGLELLPQRLASLAILPLQLRLVYQVGKRYGYELDRGHVKDFLATLGVGMTSQLLEGFARKLAQNLFGGLGGALVAGIAGRATGSALAFGTTYALGHVAKRYYAGGRSLTGAELKETFTSLLSSARSVEARQADAIRASARGIDLGSLASLVRGA